MVRILCLKWTSLAQTLNKNITISQCDRLKVLNLITSHKLNTYYNWTQHFEKAIILKVLLDFLILIMGLYKYIVNAHKN